MAIIGPRPLLVRYLDRYNEEQRHRHDVRPGLTKEKSLVLVAVRVMEEMTGMKIERKEEEETVNVCKGLRDLQEKGRVEGIQIGAEHEQRLTKALLHEDLLYTDQKQNFEDAVNTFEEINRIFAAIDE